MKSLLLALVVSAGCLPVRAETNTSAQAGDWHATNTWSLKRVPQTGDVVNVHHALVVTQSVDVGDSISCLWSNNARLVYALKVKEGGSLVVGTNATLTVRGHLCLNSTLTLQEGAALVLNSEAAVGPGFTNYWVSMFTESPSYTPRIIARGTADHPCRIESIPANQASLMGGQWSGLATTNNGLITYSAYDAGIDAEHTTFKGLGSGLFFAWSYTPGSKGGYRLQDCVFDGCGRVVVKGAANIKVPITTSFERVIWKNSRPRHPAYNTAGYYGILQTGGSTALVSSCILRQCDVDLNTLLFDLDGYTIEDCVFRGGALNPTFTKVPPIFRRNLLRYSYTQNDNLKMPYGMAMEDCLIMHDSTNWNPHLQMVIGGTGTAVVRRCIYWLSSTNFLNYDGDGPHMWGAASGTRDMNEFIIENCIFMPNGRGPDDGKGLSCNLTSGAITSNNSRVTIRRNTSFGQGVAIGETSPTVTGVIKYLKSNLFIGPTNFTGTKMNDYGHGETNAVAAANADYNAGYRLKQGSNFIATNQTGKGYDLIKLSGDLSIGQHDIDDVDPQFVDPWRNPRTWSLARGGDGTVANACDLLRPTGTNTVQDLLDYLREGFRPQNPRLKRAGDPAAGSPDIGAVDLAPDTDGDGIPDDEEFGHPVFQIGIDDRAVDADDDRINNAGEYIAGTDPGDKTSRFAIDTTPAESGVHIHFHGVTGRLYEVSFSTNLLSGTWQLLSGGLEGANAPLVIEDTGMPDEGRYYRGQVTRP